MLSVGEDLAPKTPVMEITERKSILGAHWAPTPMSDRRGGLGTAPAPFRASMCNMWGGSWPLWLETHPKIKVEVPLWLSKAVVGSDLPNPVSPGC